jgi:arylsulfatase A-like enzyme
MWDDCVFAVTADHGEEFLEHGGRMHTPPGVTEELVHVPFLLRVPAVDGQRISSPFSLLNFAPTLLDCLQAPVPVEFKGQSCWKKIRAGEDWNDEIVVECIAGCRNPARKQDRQGARLMAVREARYKLILDFNKRAEELFDLQADPQELNPLPHDKEKPVRKRLLEHARRHIANAELAKGTRPQAVLSLRNLVGEPGKEV